MESEIDLAELLEDLGKVLEANDRLTRKESLSLKDFKDKKIRKHDSKISRYRRERPLIMSS